MTIGEQKREQVVLKEVLVGEKAALRAYENALRGPLPESARRTVQNQYEAMQRVVAQVRLLRGRDGRQLVLRLFDGRQDAADAVQLLKLGGFDPPVTEQISIEKPSALYNGGMGSRLVETLLFGATGGAMWGAVSGTLAGLGMLRLPSLGLAQAALPIQEFAWAETALGAIVAGALVGGMLGLFIGWGILGGDAYLSQVSQERGEVLVRLETTPARAAEAAQIMVRVNREARSPDSHAVA
jgi:hypothetical protein